MNPPGPKLYVRVKQEVRGPYAMAQLHELASVQIITPATAAAENPAGPWVTLAQLPAGPVLFPPRPALQFKAAEFERVNSPHVAPVDHHDVIAAANRPLSAGAVAAANAASAANPRPAPAPVVNTNEVLAMVQEVGRIESALNPPAAFDPGKKRGRRRFVHYLVLFALGNGALAFIPWHYHAPLAEYADPILLGWGVLYNVGLAYGMFVLTPRY